MSFAVSTKPSSPFWSGNNSPFPWGAGLLLALLLHAGIIFWLTYRPVVIQPAASFTPAAFMLVASTQPESVATVQDAPEEIRQKQAAAPPVEAIKEQEEVPVKPTQAPDPEIVVAKKVQSKPKPKPKVQPQPVKAPEEVKAPEPAAPSALTSTPAGNPQPNVAAPSTDTVNTPSRQQANWTSLLLQRLERYKRYPVQAQRQQARGVVSINLTLNRDGQVLNVTLEKSSGVPSLDNEALALPARASPLPPLPDDMAEGKAQISVIVPIRFDLRQ